MRPYYRLSGKWGLTQLDTGQPFFVDVESRDLTAWIIMLGRWEMFVDDVLCALARPGGTFIDIGANMGYYTVKVGGIVGATGKVYAFEANPEMFDFVQENININGYYPFATGYNLAVGEEPGELILSYDRAHPGGGTMHLAHETPRQDWVGRPVPVAPIDDVLPADAVVDLIKIDIEGFEPLAFRGMKQLLARSPDCSIVTEVSYHHWNRFGRPADTLREISGDKRLFRIFTDGALVEIDKSKLEESFDHSFVSYVLMLPNDPERFSKIQHLVKG
jgi:FkbM family methyltransferase